MVKHGRMEGIAGDRKLIDNYYLYTKMKKEIDEKTKENGELHVQAEIIRDKKKCCICYLMVLSHCVKQIDMLPLSQTQRSYLDWIRWNRLINLTQLRRFKNDPYLQENVELIETLIIKIQTLLDENFVFNEAEKAISNQYAHAMARIQRQTEQSVSIDIRVLQHCAKLLINYMNNLKNRCYIKSLDRPGYSIEQLKSEAEDLITSLRRMNDTALATDLKDALDHFMNFREFDETEAASVEELIQHSLELAHERATETWLQSAKRQLTEVINQIKLAASRKIGQILEASSVLAHPLLHPIDTLKNMGYAIIHPINTSKELWKRAKENPWKCAAIVVGSIAVGVGIGLGVTGIVLALDLAITAVSLSPGVLGVLAIVSSAAAASALINTVVTGGRVLMTEQDAQRKIAKQEAKQLALIDQNTAEGKKIASQIKLNKMMREQLESTEEAFKQMQRLEEEFEESRRKQFNEMTPEELSNAEAEFGQQLNEVEEGLEATKNNLLTEQQKANEIQRNLTMLKDGKAALAFLLQNVKQNNSDIPSIDELEEE
uniref:Uncharacterized protein n=1 Tax=Panagrolaimus sp. PS1159 TaxID=55785 RepID=A0AC35FP51_9BILA